MTPKVFYIGHVIRKVCFRASIEWVPHLIHPRKMLRVYIYIYISFKNVGFFSFRCIDSISFFLYLIYKEHYNFIPYSSSFRSVLFLVFWCCFSCSFLFFLSGTRVSASTAFFGRSYWMDKMIETLSTLYMGSLRSWLGGEVGWSHFLFSPDVTHCSPKALLESLSRCPHLSPMGLNWGRLVPRSEVCVPKSSPVVFVERSQPLFVE